jgi:hypothetical protein
VPDDSILRYNQVQAPANAAICTRLAELISEGLPEAEGKVWHGGPVWFLSENPVVGYWVRKSGVQLLFWSGQSFDEPGLKPQGKSKAAEAGFASADEIDPAVLTRWLGKACEIQWDYKNIVKRKGVLERVRVE